MKYPKQPTPLEEAASLLSFINTPLQLQDEKKVIEECIKQLLREVRLAKFAFNERDEVQLEQLNALRRLDCWLAIVIAKNPEEILFNLYPIILDELIKNDSCNEIAIVMAAFFKKESKKALAYFSDAEQTGKFDRLHSTTKVNLQRCRLNHVLAYQHPLLGIVPLLTSFFAEPHAMVASLLLLQQDLSAAAIIDTGLLHDFFKYYQYDLDSVREFYTLLANNGGEKLYQAAKKITCGERGFERFSLTGEILENLGKASIIKPSFFVTMTEKNITLLHAGFCINFLQEIINFLSVDDCQKLHTFVKRILNTSDSLLQLGELVAIFSRYTGGKRDILFQILADLLYEETLSQLLKKNTMAIYLLQYKPKLVRFFNKRNLKKYITEITNPQQESFEQLSQLTTLFNALKERRYLQWIVFKKLLKISLSNSDLVSSDKEFKNVFQSYDLEFFTRDYINQTFNSLEQELRVFIRSQFSGPEQVYDYSSIEESWKNGLNQYNFLKEIVLVKFSYLPNRYALRAAVIQEMLQLNLRFELEEIVDNMVKHYSNLEFRANDKRQTLVEILLKIEEKETQKKTLHLLDHDEDWIKDQNEMVDLIKRAIEEECIILLDYLNPTSRHSVYQGRKELDKKMFSDIFLYSLTHRKLKAIHYFCGSIAQHEIGYHSVIELMLNYHIPIEDFIGKDSLPIDLVFSYAASTDNLELMERLLKHQPSKICITQTLAIAVKEKKPDLIHFLSPLLASGKSNQADINEHLCLVTALNVDNSLPDFFKQLSQLVSHFQELKSERYLQWRVFKKIITLYLAYPDLACSDDAFLPVLANYYNPLLANYFSQILAELQQGLCAFIHNQLKECSMLTVKVYNDIERYWYHGLKQHKLLKKINPIKEAYLPDKQGLRIAIIHEMLQLKLVINLESVVEIMVKQKSDQGISLQSAKNKVLYWAAKTGHLDVFKFVVNLGSRAEDGILLRAEAIATQMNHRNIIDWLTRLKMSPGRNGFFTHAVAETNDNTFKSSLAHFR